MTNETTERAEPAFLLAQIGAYASSQFAEKLKVLALAPSDAGILRLLRVAAGLSQQGLAARLGIHPSRLVAILDILEKRGLLERRPNPDDRRLYSLYLTKDGEEILGKIGRIAREHHESLLSPLNNEERAVLGSLLLRLSGHHGLARGVHPGYRLMGSAQHSPVGETRQDAKPADPIKTP
jgi:DNA-binding MarR family transcriptional regulator